MTPKSSPATAIRLNAADTVAVLVQAVRRGETVYITGPQAPLSLTALEDIPRYHKIALRACAAGQKPSRNGIPIGVARAAIAAGAWVHTHNLVSAYAHEAKGNNT